MGKIKNVSDLNNSNRDIIYLHCGYPKTATTTFQKWVFPKLKEINYIGQYHTKKGKTDLQWKKINEGFTNESKIHNDTAFNEAVIELEKIRLSATKASLLSLEKIISECILPETLVSYKGTLNSPPSLFYILTYSKDLAEAAGFKEVKPIITLRSQDKLLASLYAQVYNKYRNIVSFRHFTDFLDVWFGANSSLSPGAVDYYELNAILKQIFGLGNFKFLMFEWLEQNICLFCEELSEFIGVNSSELINIVRAAQGENIRRLDDESVWNLARLNASGLAMRTRAKFFKRSLGIGKYFDKLFSKIEYGPRKFELKENDKARINQFYWDSNVRFVKSYPDFQPLLAD